MKRFCGIALLALLTLCPLQLMAAKKLHESFVLPVDVRVGDLLIPKGQYNVTWTEPSGSQVQLTLKAEERKPLTIPARLIVEKHDEAGVTTINENGISYLQDLHTTKETFILPGAPSVAKQGH